MKTVKKNVYYCDHCKKKGLNKHHLEMHETFCTANPNRRCRLCKTSINIGAIVQHFKSKFHFVIEKRNIGEPWERMYQDVEVCVWHDRPVTLQHIRDKTDNCPICILAVLRQTKLFYAACGLEEFDYQKEAKEVLSDRQQDYSEYL